MYVQACDATNVQGEQSGEVLDLRMACLAENLDQVRALTEVLISGETGSTAHATTAAQDLPRVERCRDAAALRSGIPAPRDEHTASAVRELTKVINDINALEELGNVRAAHVKALAIRRQVESVGYKPLLAKLLYATGALETMIDPVRAEGVLEDAVFEAQACRDDLTVAMAAADLILVVGERLGRTQDADKWARLAIATLDRMPQDQPRIRSWVLHDQASVLWRGYPQRARALLEQSLSLKRSVLGKDHPDVARTLTVLGVVMTDLGHPEDGLRLADQAVQILWKPEPESALLATVLNNRGETLTLLGRYPEATRDFRAALRIWHLHLEPTSPVFAHPLHGLGEVKRSEGDLAAAIPLFEEALRIREQREPNGVVVADTQFALARCLWESGRGRARARLLASRAHDLYENRAPIKQRVVAEWINQHRPVSRAASQPATRRL